MGSGGNLSVKVEMGTGGGGWGGVAGSKCGDGDWGGEWLGVKVEMGTRGGRGWE